MPNTLTTNWINTNVWKPNLFDGKVVFVTGGAGSICRVQAEALVLLGANAVIIGRNAAKTEEAAREIQSLRLGSRVIGIGNVDVRRVQDLAKCVERTVSELGRIDFVIAGAAGNFLSSIAGLTSNAFKSVIDIDLLGSYNTLKATLDQLKKHKGQIIFVSASFHFTGTAFQAHPAAAKAGVDALMATAALELGPFGVRSNCITPGPIGDTEGVDRLLSGLEGQRVINDIPLRRLGTKADIADATVYLFSPAADYITGHVLVVDGAKWRVTNSRWDENYPQTIIEANSIKNKL